VEVGERDRRGLSLMTPCETVNGNPPDYDCDGVVLIVEQ